MFDDLPQVDGRLECTLYELERRARIHLADEQAKPLPDNALIATLCDTVRLVREYSERISGPIYDLSLRADETEKYLREQRAADPFKEQRHLDAGTVERAYWHHGYLQALRDVLQMVWPTGPGDPNG